MNDIKKSQYSLFKKVVNLEKSTDKKEYKIMLENFKNTICEIYCIDRNLLIEYTKKKNEIIDFLCRVGILENREEYEYLKKILKSQEIKNLFSVIFKFLELKLSEKEYDDNLLKYMDFYRKIKLQDSLKSSSPTLVDLFCGSGGLSLGFIQNGFRSILANDIEQVCINTYSFNHLELPRDRAKVGDIKDISENIEKYILIRY